MQQKEKIEVPKTYGEAIARGWTCGDTAWERGYISRVGDNARRAVRAAGGNRKGDYYVLMPSWQSTSYCVRQYIYPPTTSNN